MSNYSIINNWSLKDGLDPGDPEKVIQATQFYQEFNAIATAIASKTDTAGSVTSVNTATGAVVLDASDIETGVNAGETLLHAFRATVASGSMPGWAMAPSGGTATEPQYITYSLGVNRIRKTLTWSGGNVTSAVYAFSTNSGVNYTTISTSTITYDGSGNVTGITWA